MEHDPSRDRAPAAEEVPLSEARKRTRRSFIIGGTATIAGLSAWRWILTRPEDGGTPWPLRQSFRFNEALSRKFFDPQRIEPMPDAPPPGSPARFNGDLGISSPIDLQLWRLRVDSPASAPLFLTLETLRHLPQTRTRTQFKCIEGWSMNISYQGVKFTDFLKAYPVGRNASGLYPYVAFETPDREYYVSIDMESMLHPQTLLATHLNDVPLSLAHGAPLRLIIPIKYGIKSLKRIGRMYFSETRPPDYWAERGYDWYSGL